MILQTIKYRNWISKGSKKLSWIKTIFCLFLNVKFVTWIKTYCIYWQNLCKISMPVKNHVVPDGPIFFAIKEWEDYFQFLSQIGAHQTLHLHKKMVAASWYWCVFFSMTMLHLKISQTTQQPVWIICENLKTKRGKKHYTELLS